MDQPDLDTDSVKKNDAIQVTRSVDTGDSDLSPQEKRTVDSIVMAR